MFSNMPRPALRRDDDRGFTLIETLVVFAIIGIILAIGIPALLNNQRNSRGAAMDATAENVTNSMFGMAISENTAANSGKMVIDAFNELPLESRLNVDIKNRDGANFAPVTAADRDMRSLAIFHRQGDTVRMGCIFLPSRAAQGERPIYLRHGEQFDAAVRWDSTVAYAAGRYANVKEPGCNSASMPTAGGGETRDTEYTWTGTAVHDRTPAALGTGAPTFNWNATLNGS